MEYKDPAQATSKKQALPQLHVFKFHKFNVNYILAE